MGRQAQIKSERRRAAAQGFEVPKRTQERDVDLLGSIAILNGHMTEALCHEVFGETRIAERERDWTLSALARFWTAVILRKPKSLTQAFEEAKRANGNDELWPMVEGTRQAFFDRSKTLRSDFFAGLFHRFVESTTPEAPASFCSEFAELRRFFPEIFVIDGSRLDKIAHRLKILRNVRSVILPGNILALYDLFRGCPRRILFDADAASAEIPRARKLLGHIPEGTLLLGDRGFASVVLFSELEERHLYGVLRLTKTLSFTRVGPASPRRKYDGGVLEDEFIDLGSGQTTTPQTVRLIRYRSGSFSIKLLTNVLDPEKLSGDTIVRLYRARWTIERMYFDLKSVLGLQDFYAANPNAVAMQVYAAAMVYVAMRISQARIANENKFPPEEISPAKFFPRMADACATYAGYLLGVRDVARQHPNVKIETPDPTGHPRFTARLGSLLRERRNDNRRRRTFCASRASWASIKHVRGGPALIKRS